MPFVLFLASLVVAFSVLNFSISAVVAIILTAILIYVVFSKTSSADYIYDEMAQGYIKLDGLIAIAFFTIKIVAFYIAGWALNNARLYLGVPISLALLALVFVILRIKKQGLATIGLTSANFGKSSLLGLSMSVPFIIRAAKMFHVEHFYSINFLYSVFFYLVVISFCEEVSFRGYIQTRLHGLIKSGPLAILVGGLMFATMHIPFQAAWAYFATGQTLMQWIEPLQLLLWIWNHIIFVIMYRRFNSLAGPVIFHFFVNFSIIQPIFFV